MAVTLSSSRDRDTFANLNAISRHMSSILNLMGGLFRGMPDFDRSSPLRGHYG
jgi:hypothetical protein